MQKAPGLIEFLFSEPSGKEALSTWSLVAMGLSSPSPEAKVRSLGPAELSSTWLPALI